MDYLGIDMWNLRYVRQLGQWLEYEKNRWVIASGDSSDNGMKYISVSKERQYTH